MRIEIRYFLIFQNILGAAKNFRNRKDFFFQVLPRTISTKSQVHPMMSSYLELVNM